MKTKSRNKRVTLLTSTLIIVLCGAMGYLAVPTVSADVPSETIQEEIKKSTIKNTSLGVLFGIIIVVTIAAIKGCFPC